MLATLISGSDTYRDVCKSEANGAFTCHFDLIDLGENLSSYSFALVSKYSLCCSNREFVMLRGADTTTGFEFLADLA